MRGVGKVSENAQSRDGLIVSINRHISPLDFGMNQKRRQQDLQNISLD